MYEQAMMLQHGGKSIRQMTTALKKSYRYINGSERSGVKTIEGLIGTKYNTIFLTDRFLDKSKAVLTYMNSSYPLMYKVNGVPTSLYGLMKQFDALMNSNLYRFKGLGELEDYMFKEAVMDPDSHRTFIQYTLDSAMEEIEAIRAYESDKSKILDHVENVTRLDLME
jgi:DNA gyrase/topoisomerase IV subunit B